jgi:hypothetical protein
LLSLAGGAAAATNAAPVADLPSQKAPPNHEIILGEEEISDVSLSTFYVFDKESAKSQLGDKVAQRWMPWMRRLSRRRLSVWRRLPLWRGGCGGGCGGCGGCGCGCGCCLSWGGCAIC